jgi:hypothetical protein
MAKLRSLPAFDCALSDFPRFEGGALSSPPFLRAYSERRKFLLRWNRRAVGNGKVKDALLEGETPRQCGWTLKRSALRVFVIFVCAVPSAGAQDSTHRSATVASGQQIRLSAHFNLNRDCSSGAAPDVRVVTPPKNGELSIRSGNARAPQIRNCQNVDVPARLVFYRSNRGYSGNDHVAYEITKADRTTETQNVTISVTVPSTPPGRNDKIDL